MSPWFFLLPLWGVHVSLRVSLLLKERHLLQNPTLKAPKPQNSAFAFSLKGDVILCDDLCVLPKAQKSASRSIENLSNSIHGFSALLKKYTSVCMSSFFFLPSEIFPNTQLLKRSKPSSMALLRSFQNRIIDSVMLFVLRGRLQHARHTGIPQCSAAISCRYRLCFLHAAKLEDHSLVHD
jgi:hypothetical protein